MNLPYATFGVRAVLLLIKLTRAVAHPALNQIERSIVTDNYRFVPEKYTEAPNANITWIESLDVAPALVSFHYEKLWSAKVHELPEFLTFLKFLEEVILCPIFIELDAQTRNRTAVLKPETIISLRSLADDNEKDLIYVLTDNKSYFVTVGPSTDESDVPVLSITKLVDRLAPEDELRIREKLDELNFDSSAAAVVTAEDCLKYVKH